MPAPEIEAENIPCPLCAQKKDHVLMPAMDRLYGIEGEFTLVQCERCDLIYLNPQPTLATLSRYYPDDREMVLLKQITKWSGSRKPLGYRLKRLWVRALGRCRPLHPEIQLLDVGCANGSFLFALQEAKGIKGTGVELSSQMAAYCRNQSGLDVRAGTLMDQQFPGNSFDIVTMFAYFEHETHPLPVLRETKRILKENGLLMMAVPNVDSLLFRIFKGYWHALNVPRHVVQYSAKTACEILERGGFEVIALNHLPKGYLVPSLGHIFGIAKHLWNLPPILFIVTRGGPH